MNIQRIIEETRETEAEFLYRLSQYLSHRSDDAADAKEARVSIAYMEAHSLVSQAATVLSEIDQHYNPPGV